MVISSKNLPHKGKEIKGIAGTYIIGDRLGRGGNGTVFDVTTKNNTALSTEPNGYVIKVLNVAHDPQDEYQRKRLERFQREVTIIKKIEDVPLQVIPIRDSFMEGESSEEFYWYLMPKASEYRFRGYEKSRQKLMGFLKLGFTLCELDKRQIYHRDIKPQNILYYRNNIYLTDFGLVWCNDFDAHITGEGEAVGPYAIRPPEMENGYDKLAIPIDYAKVDVYLFAKTLWIILTGRTSGFPGEYNRADAQVNLHMDCLKIGQTLEPLHRLMEGATTKVPSDRITMQECCKWIEMQLAVCDGKIDEKQLKLMQYDESVEFARKSIPADVMSYTDTKNIMRILQSLVGKGQLTLFEFQEIQMAGEINSVRLLDENIMEISVKEGNIGTRGMTKEKKCVMNAAILSIDLEKQVNVEIKRIEKDSDWIRKLGAGLSQETIILNNQHSIRINCI